VAVLGLLRTGGDCRAGDGTKFGYELEQKAKTGSGFGGGTARHNVGVMSVPIGGAAGQPGDVSNPHRRIGVAAG